ncbi:MAG: asparagine synthase (glutamine-hydrolyzing) [Nitrospirota bacterium]
MCGIAGIYQWDGKTPDQDRLHRMIQTIRHRGPDGTGVFAEGPVGLAHARLSIIDLSGGHQPMANDDQSLWVTFNGEIFNYLELRQYLVDRGYRFSTTSDTEVLLQMYADKGEDCVKYFNGQWAFAIWDKKRNRLFLSRDRAGIRPLFYTTLRGAFVFGSEIKSIFAHSEVKREIDVEALDQIFTFWCTLPPKTAFQGVYELPPGSSMIVEAGKVTVRSYWKMDYTFQDEAEKSEEEYAGILHDLLVDATRIRLRADVPVGAYLSGGLDSSVIVSLMKKANASLETFSVGFADSEFDESGFQKQAIDYFGTKHRDVFCKEDEIGRIFPDVLWHMEKPVVRTAPAPLFMLSQLVRDARYKVVLTGEGSDEILGGYDIFKEAKVRHFWGRHPESQMRPRLLKRLYPYLPNLQKQSESYLKAFFYVRPDDVNNPFFSHLPRWELTARMKMFYSDEVQSKLGGGSVYKTMEELLPKGFLAWDPFLKAQYLEFSGLLPGYILSSQGDRVAMAHSVEGRFPFLDYRVIEFAAKIPTRLKMKVLNEKYLLKKSFQNLIPETIRKRSKQPYRAPEGKSFFGTHPPDYVMELLSPDRIAQGGLFHPERVQKLVEKFRRGQAIGLKENMAIIAILSTQLLVDQFIHHFEERIAYGGH